MTFAEKLKSMRKQSGMSQEKLAEKIGVSRQAITKWENNTGIPDIENMLALSSLFNVSVDELLSNEKIEKKQTGQGIQWLADWLNQRSGKASCVVIDGRNGVDVLVEKITGKDGTWKAKNSVIRPGVRDVIASVSVLTDALAGETVTWYELQEELNDSAMTAIKRPIGGGWGFGGDNSAPIEAAALALWGAKTSKRDPNRKMRIG